jgi:ParB family chromosome partitioning protein
MGYDQLIQEFEYTQNDLAAVIGKSRSHVANTLRLLKLPETVKQYLNDGALTAGHARALIAAPDPAGLAKRIVEEGLTVRSAETLAQATISEPHGRAKTPKPDKDADTRAIEKRLSDALGLAVEIRHKPDGSGEMRLRYVNLDQLDDIIRRLEA